MIPSISAWNEENKVSSIQGPDPMLQSIMLVCPYFGGLPGWFPYFVESCRYNPTINFCIYSDAEPPADLPDNLEMKKMTFADYNAHVRDRLQISFDQARLYKLCDLKPATGYLHEDVFEGYDFWGYCDIDLIFGDIRAFLTPEVLSHDVISTHAVRTAGHFSIFRNTKEYRNAFMNCKNWKEIYEDPKNHRFSERIFPNQFVRFKRIKFLQKLWEKTVPIARNLYFEEQYTTHSAKIGWLDGSLNFPTEWYWKKGKVTNNASTREFIYYHFMRWKTYWDDSIDWSAGDCKADEWTITPAGFFTGDDQVNASKSVDPAAYHGPKLKVQSDVRDRKL